MKRDGRMNSQAGTVRYSTGETRQSNDVINSSEVGWTMVLSPTGNVWRPYIKRTAKDQNAKWNVSVSYIG